MKSEQRAAPTSSGTRKLGPPLEGGEMYGRVATFESEEAMRRGDEALTAMSLRGTERRTSLVFFEVPVKTVG
jgi:hypothetical protein